MVGHIIRALTSSKEDQAILFDRLMEETHRQAYGVAFRLTGNRSEAEDLLQETYLRAYRFFYRYDSAMPFASWLYRIMTNLHIDQMRKKKRFKLISLDDRTNDEEIQVADPGGQTDLNLMDDTLAEPLQLALRATNADFRMAVILADIEGLSYEEIAEIMESSVGTVRSRIHRGRKQIRTYLEGNFPTQFAVVAKESGAGL
jgi:RNA polymerase sigma-70 factor (ECF subfamily)